MRNRRILASVLGAVMALSVAGIAFADTGAWTGNGWPNVTCTDTSATMLWIWTGDAPTALTINGEAQTGSWVQEGGNGSWHFEATIDATNYPPTTTDTFVTFTGTAGVLTLSHCSGTTATPTPTPTPTPTLPPTNTLDQTPTSPAGTSLTLLFGLILAVAGGLVAYAMRPRRSNR